MPKVQRAVTRPQPFESHLGVEGRLPEACVYRLGDQQAPVGRRRRPGADQPRTDRHGALEIVGERGGDHRLDEPDRPRGGGPGAGTPDNVTSAAAKPSTDPRWFRVTTRPSPSSASWRMACTSRSYWESSSSSRRRWCRRRRLVATAGRRRRRSVRGCSRPPSRPGRRPARSPPVESSARRPRRERPPPLAGRRLLATVTPARRTGVPPARVVARPGTSARKGTSGAAIGSPGG